MSLSEIHIIHCLVQVQLRKTGNLSDMTDEKIVDGNKKASKQTNKLTCCYNMAFLQHNDRTKIRQICSIKPEDVAILRERRPCWFGHVERSSGAVRTACDIQIDGRGGGGPS